MTENTTKKYKGNPGIWDLLLITALIAAISLTFAISPLFPDFAPETRQKLVAKIEKVAEAELPWSKNSKTPEPDTSPGEMPYLLLEEGKLKCVNGTMVVLDKDGAPEQWLKNDTPENVPTLKEKWTGFCVGDKDLWDKFLRTSEDGISNADILASSICENSGDAQNNCPKIVADALLDTAPSGEGGGIFTLPAIISGEVEPIKTSEPTPVPTQGGGGGSGGSTNPLPTPTPRSKEQQSDPLTVPKRIKELKEQLYNNSPLGQDAVEDSFRPESGPWVDFRTSGLVDPISFSNLIARTGVASIFNLEGLTRVETFCDSSGCTAVTTETSEGRPLVAVGITAPNEIDLGNGYVIYPANTQISWGNNPGNWCWYTSPEIWISNCKFFPPELNPEPEVRELTYVAEVLESYGINSVGRVMFPSSASEPVTFFNQNTKISMLFTEGDYALLAQTFNPSELVNITSYGSYGGECVSISEGWSVCREIHYLPDPDPDAVT